MGIRNRIALGFISLGFLLFIAGLISYFELARLGESTTKTVDKGTIAINKAKNILDLLEEQDNLIIKEISIDTMIYSDQNNQILDKLEATISETTDQLPDDQNITKLTNYNNQYQKNIKNLKIITSKEDVIDWYFKYYKPAYRQIINTTNDFIITTQKDVVQKTKEIESLAYRATMQGITAIAAAIVILLIFFYMIDIYFVRPVVGITQALKKYLTSKTPLDVKLEGKEEVYTLYTYAKQLTAIINNLRKERNEQRSK